MISALVLSYASTILAQTGKKEIVVVLDPAFGGEETGAIGTWGLEEKDVVLEIALGVERMISKHRPNIKTYLTRTEDKSIFQKEREAFIKVHNPTLVVRFRLNSSNNEELEGFSARYDRKNKESKKLGKIILRNIGERLITPDEGLKPADIYKNIQVPTVEVLPGYITNPDIEANFRIPEVNEAIADAICKSILQFLE